MWRCRGLIASNEPEDADRYGGTEQRTCADEVQDKKEFRQVKVLNRDPTRQHPDADCRQAGQQTDPDPGEPAGATDHVPSDHSDYRWREQGYANGYAYEHEDFPPSKAEGGGRHSAY